jgi:hypothetical protein
MNKNYCDPQLLAPLKDFCSRINDDWDSGYYWGPFLPYVMGKYNESKVKTFFIGRDTRAWIDEKKYGSGLEYLENLYKENDLNQYLAANSELDPYDIEKWNNNTSAFWTFVSKLYLSIITQKKYFSIKVQDYSESDMEVLKCIGYGNLYAIEKKESLEKEDFAGNSWKYIKEQGNKKKYEHIFNTANDVLNKYKFIADIYSPKISFCFCWEFDDWDKYFDGCNYDWLEEYSCPDRYCTYKVQFHNKVSFFIETKHPSSLKFKCNEGRERLMQELVNVYNKLVVL